MQEHLSSDELETMRRLLRSGIRKNRTKAVAIGADAAMAAGLARALAGAAIGTALLPGIGTAIGAALTAWVAQKKASETKDK